jgi:hypothetical protein
MEKGRINVLILTTDLQDFKWMTGFSIYPVPSLFFLFPIA